MSRNSQSKAHKPKENQAGNMSVFSLANYTAPQITEEPNRRWVKYGENDNYFDYLLERYRGSATNHALINGIYQMIVGDGLVVTGGDEQQVNEMFAYDDLLKWAFDLKCLGYYIQQVILSKDGSKIAKVIHTPVQNWRSGIADENGIVNEYWYCDDWNNSTYKRYKPVSYPVYTVGTKEPLSILPVKPYRAGTFYYPNVDYQGGLQYAHIEEEISNFHINNLLNGMFPGLLINFNNGDPGVEERKNMEYKVNSKWGGTSNTAKIIMAFNDSKENAATVEAVTQSDLDKMFDLLNSQSSEKIFISHRVTSPTLFGVRAGAGLGNNADELRVSSILFEETVLRLYRKLFVNNIESLLKVNGNEAKISFKSLNPFPDFLQAPTEEPNKMNIDSGATVEKLEEHKHTPEMTAEQEKLYLDAMNPYGEQVDEDLWFDADASPVLDGEAEDKLFSKNGSK